MSRVDNEQDEKDDHGQQAEDDTEVGLAAFS
jgi:hypothetical protein